MSERTIAFLGGGRMGEALVAGLLSAGGRTTDEILVTCRRRSGPASSRDRLGVATTLDNAEACRAARFSS